MIDDNKKRMRAVGTAAVLGLAVPLALLVWMWPADKPPALEMDGAPGPIIPFSIDKITEEEAGRTIVAASDFSLIAPSKSGEFTTESGFGSLITMSTSGEEQPSAAGGDDARPQRQPGNMAVATVGSGIAGPSGGSQAVRQRAPSGPVQVARIGGGSGAAGGGSPSSSSASGGATDAPAGESSSAPQPVAFADQPDLLREPADGPVPQAVACANEAANLSQPSDPAVECEPAAQPGFTPASPTLPNAPRASGSSSNGGGSSNGGTQVVDAGDDGQGEGQDPAGNGEPGPGEGGSGSEGDAVATLAGPNEGDPLLQNTANLAQPVVQAASAIPEPASLVLAMTALVGVGVARRKSGR